MKLLGRVKAERLSQALNTLNRISSRRKDEEEGRLGSRVSVRRS